jgi:DNA-binding FadR family transcriptional regulator
MLAAGGQGRSSRVPDGFDAVLPAVKIRRGRCYRVAPMGDDHLARAGNLDALDRTASSRRFAQRRPGAAESPRPHIPRVVKLAETVAHEIARDISAKRLRPGSRLQDIRSVKNRYHVSNSSVRESLRMLEMLGLLSVKPGPQGGPVVRQVTTEDFALATTFYYHILDVRVSDLMDARVALEPILVRFVAKQQSPTVLKRLRWYLTGVDREDASATVWHTQRSPTASFHRALVETGNPMLDIMVHSLQECWLDMRRGFPFPRDVSHHDRDHVRIAEAILCGKETEAEQLMQRHMDYVATFANMHFTDLMEKVIDWE